MVIFPCVAFVHQSYDSKFLKIYSELKPTPLQLEEDLEQLKVLENGYKMKVLLDFSLNALIKRDTSKNYKNN